jgi:hypothetical protein
VEGQRWFHLSVDYYVNAITHADLLGEGGELLGDNFRSLLLGNHNLEAVKVTQVSSSSLGLVLLGPSGGVPSLQSALLLIYDNNKRIVKKVQLDTRKELLH